MTSYDSTTSTFPTIPSNIAAQLPSVHFGFDELKERISKFTLEFDQFIEARRVKMLEDKNAFIKEIADVKGIKRKRNILPYR